MKVKIAITASIFLLASIAVIVAILFVPKNVAGSNFEIRVEKNSLTRYVGDSFNVEEFGIKFTPEDKAEVPTYISSNSLVATISAFSGDIDCIGCGVAIITITLKVNENEKVSKTVTLIVEDIKVYPSSVSLAMTEVKMSPCSTTYNSLIMEGYNVNVVPVVTYQSNLVTYNWQTGEILSGAVSGQDIVTIKIPVSKTQNITKTFKVIIEDVLYCFEQIDINLGETKRISYSEEFALTLSESQVISVLIENQNIICLLESDYCYIIIKGISTGTTNIIISSEGFVLTITIIVH